MSRGFSRQRSGFPTNVSVDRMVANAIRGDTVLPSLEVSCNDFTNQKETKARWRHVPGTRTLPTRPLPSRFASAPVDDSPVPWRMECRLPHTDDVEVPAMPRPLISATAVFCAGILVGLSTGNLGLSPLVFFGIVAVAAVAAGILATRSRPGDSFLGGGSFLCDTCRYNSERDCSRPERPNATRCPDYSRR